MAEAVGHTLVVLALIGAYVALELTGHDGAPVLYALGGYGGGATAGATLARASGRGPGSGGASGVGVGGG